MIQQKNKNKNILVKKEGNTDYNYREYLDRDKDAIVLPGVSRDRGNIYGNMVLKRGGKFVLKRETFITSLSPRPKPFGNMKRSKITSKKVYENNLREHFLKSKDKLNKFIKIPEILVYICFYLGEKKFDSSDLDNYIGVILDVLKEFVGDDKKIVSLYLDKKKIVNAPIEDIDFFEQSLIFISTPDAKKDLFKNPKYCFDLLEMLNRQEGIKFRGGIKIKK